MRIAMFTSYDAGGTWEVAKPIADELLKLGHYVTLEAIGRGHSVPKDRTLSDYDIAHFWNIEEMKHFDPAVPTVVTVNSLCPETDNGYKQMLQQLNPDHIHTHDSWMVRYLGQRGITNVTSIPQAFDHSKWPVLPLPREFAVGYVGDPAYKRFDVIEAAAKLAGVPCYSLLADPWHPQQEVLDFYRKISCYVVTSFNDSGPLPAQEALLCGRPVVTTHVGMMDDTVLDGDNGYFHDGSVEDCAKKILEAKESLVDGDFDPGLEAVHEYLISPSCACVFYLHMYEELLESWT